MCAPFGMTVVLVGGRAAHGGWITLPTTAPDLGRVILRLTLHLERTPFLDDGSHALGLDDAEHRRLVEVVDDQARVGVAWPGELDATEETFGLHGSAGGMHWIGRL